jgi:outer membrane lipoprotein carrier protein
MSFVTVTPKTSSTLTTLALLLSALLCALYGTAPAFADAESDPVVDAMQAYYEKVQIYSANFEQTSTEITGIQSAPSRGTVWFMKPGRMRWDYETPDEKYMISDGSTFWIWEPNLLQYCKRDLASSSLPTALTFLSGTGDIRKEFNVALAPSKTPGEQRLSLSPIKPSPSYAGIEFTVDAASSQVKRVVITDSLGNTNTLVFSEPEINDAIGNVDPAHFSFSPPANATDMCEKLNQ